MTSLVNLYNPNTTTVLIGSRAAGDLAYSLTRDLFEKDVFYICRGGCIIGQRLNYPIIWYDCNQFPLTYTDLKFLKEELPLRVTPNRDLRYLTILERCI